MAFLRTVFQGGYRTTSDVVLILVVNWTQNHHVSTCTDFVATNHAHIWARDGVYQRPGWGEQNFVVLFF